VETVAIQAMPMTTDAASEIMFRRDMIDLLSQANRNLAEIVSLTLTCVKKPRADEAIARFAMIKRRKTSGDARLSWINGHANKPRNMNTIFFLENSDENCRAVSRALRVLRACDRSNLGMPVGTKGQRPPRLLRPGRAANQQKQACCRSPDAFIAGPSDRSARRGKRSFGRQDKEHLPRLLSGSVAISRVCRPVFSTALPAASS
jgi:hypothetical protein